jgi:thiol-disulfide isomerase/thioredoxin
MSTYPYAHTHEPAPTWNTVTHTDMTHASPRGHCRYFAASWCPSCRSFTPVLTKAYNDAKRAGKAIEVVFVSSDTDRAAQVAHMNEAPHGDWLRVPFDSPLRDGLKQK